MGFAKRWDVNDIINRIRHISSEANSGYTDGFTGFELKKELWLIKFAVDESLENSNRFVGEDEWLKEQQQEQLIKILKKK